MTLRLACAIFLVGLLSSCSVLKKSGIEKRRYRPGYYSSFVFSKKQVSGKFETKKEHAVIQPADPAIATTSPEQGRDLPVAALIFNTEKKETGRIGKLFAESNEYNRTHHKLLYALAQPRKHGMIAVLKTLHHSQKASWGRSGSDELGELLVTVAMGLLALVICAAFPGVDFETAQVIALGLIIVVGLIVFACSNL